MFFTFSKPLEIIRGTDLSSLLEWRNRRVHSLIYCLVPDSSFSISVVAQLVRAYDQPVKSTSSLRWSGRRLSRLQTRLCPPRLASNALKTSRQPQELSPPPYKQQQEPQRPPRPPSMQQEQQPPRQISDGPPRPLRQELSKPQLLRRHPARPSRMCLP